MRGVAGGGSTRVGWLGGARHDGRAVAELLDLRDDDLITGLEPAHDGVGAVVNLTERDRDLVSHGSPRAGDGDEGEILAALPGDGERRDPHARVRLPDHARADDLGRAELAAVRELCLDEDRLCLRVGLLGDEADRRFGQGGVRAPVFAEEHDAARVVEQAELLRGNVDVGLEGLVVIDARELGRRADVVAQLDRNVAHGALEWGDDPVVPQLRGLGADDGVLRVDRRRGHGGLALVLLELLPADEPFAEEGRGAGRVALGEGEARLALRLGGYLVGEIG